MTRPRVPQRAHFLRVLPCALVLLASLAGTPAAAAPDHWSEDWCEANWSDPGRVRVCEVRQVSLARVPKVLRVEPGENGGVEVAAGTGAGIKGQVRIEAWATTEAEARSLVADVRIVEDAEGWHAEGPAAKSTSRRGPSWNVSFRIEAPAATALDLFATNGPIGVHHMTGRMRLETENGPLAIKGGGGDVVARTQNGPLNVRLTGTNWVGRGLNARAINGPVSLSVPRDYNAEIEYGTVNGPWNGRHSEVSDDRHARYAYAKLGKGGSPLSVTTENGPFSMKRTGP